MYRNRGEKVDPVGDDVVQTKAGETERGRWEGKAQKGTTIYDIVQHFPTFVDNLHLFVPLASNIMKGHKPS